MFDRTLNTLLLMNLETDSFSDLDQDSFTKIYFHALENSRLATFSVWDVQIWLQNCSDQHKKHYHTFTSDRKFPEYFGCFPRELFTENLMNKFSNFKKALPRISSYNIRKTFSLIDFTTSMNSCLVGGGYHSLTVRQAAFTT